MKMCKIILDYLSFITKVPTFTMKFIGIKELSLITWWRVKTYVLSSMVILIISMRETCGLLIADMFIAQLVSGKIGIIIDDDFLLSQFPSSKDWNLNLLGKNKAKNKKHIKK